MQSVEEILYNRNNKNNFALFLGIKTVEIKEGYARGELPLKDEYKNIIHSIHGGCIYTLADTVCGSAGALYGEAMTTVSSDFHFLRPALHAEKLIAEATEIKHGKRIRVYRVDIFCEQAKLLATGTFTFMKLV